MRADLSLATDNRVPEGEEPFNSCVADARIPDPYRADRNVTASISLRDDTLARMYVKGGLEQWQFSTGRKLQEAFELVEAGNLKAFDPRAVHGPSVGGFFHVKNSAHERLKNVREATGKRDPKTGLSGYDLLRAVLSHGKAITTIAYEASTTSRIATRIFKNALSAAGEVLGLKSRS